MKTTKSDFTFTLQGYGHYRVTYKSPATGREWSAVTTDMQLIDATKNESDPKQKDLELLKKMCKR